MKVILLIKINFLFNVYHADWDYLLYSFENEFLFSEIEYLTTFNDNYLYKNENFVISITLSEFADIVEIIWHAKSNYHVIFLNLLNLLHPFKLAKVWVIECQII